MAQQITVGNYSALSGLAEGVNSFLTAYQTAKNIQHQQKMEELSAGVARDENGELQYTPEKQAEIQAKAAQAKGLLAEQSATSPESISLGQKRGMLAHAGNPNIPEDIYNGLSGTQQKELEPLTKPDVSGYYNLAGKQQMMNMANQRMGMMQQQRQQRNQMSANQQYSHEMGQTENTLLAANRVNALVQGIDAGKLQSTPQLKSDLSAALAQMLNSGKPATVYGMSNQEFDSAYGRAQKAYQFLTGTTGDSMTPDQLNQLKKDVNALAGEYGKQRDVKYNSFKQGLPEQVVPGLEKRFQTFGEGAKPQSPGLLSGGNSAQDPQIAKFASDNGLDYAKAESILRARGYGK